MMGPIRLAPVYLKSIWAGERLRRIRGLAERGIGISREVCTYPGSENQVSGGVFGGRTITEVIRSHGRRIMGIDGGEQMVRVAFMDTADDLSIQVHPDGVRAEACGDYEKSESWYIVEAEAGACITAGIRVKDHGVIEAAVRQGCLEELLIRHPVKAGDFVVIPAGMVHACGKNMLALEVGSFGGITYRLYDYGRGRALNLKEGLDALNPLLRCKVLHPSPRQYNCPVPAGRHDLFQVDLVEVNGLWNYEGYQSYRIITCVSGDCEINWREGSFHLNYTETIVIPAECSRVSAEGRARLLISYRY